MTDAEMLNWARSLVKRDDGSLFRLHVPEVYLFSWDEVARWGDVLRRIAEEHGVDEPNK